MLEQVRQAVEALLSGADRAAVDLDRFLWLDLSRGRLDGYGCLFFAADGSGPTVVAKAARAPARQATYRLDLDNLQRLESAGINAARRSTPRALGAHEQDGLLVTLQSALPGRLLRNIPARQLFGPAHAARTIDRAMSWLAQLEAAFGVQPRKMDPILYEAEVLSLVERVRGRYAVAPEEAEFLSRRFENERRLLGLTLPFTVAHGDFCPANLLLDEAGVGAYDWEHPLVPGLPLYDVFFFFAATRFPFRGLRGESSYATSLTAVYWGDGHLSRALREQLAAACTRLSIPREALPDLFLLALLLRADRKYDVFEQAVGPAEAPEGDEGRRREALRFLERDAPLHWVSEGTLLGLRHVVREGLPRLG